MDNPFAPNSRYSGLRVLERTDADGRVQRYLERRILPEMSRFAPMERLRLSGTERADLLASAAYGDPALWWRIADANGDPDPATLGGPEGRLLTIPLPLEMTGHGDT